MDLTRLLEAESIAVVGASAVPQKASGLMLDLLRKSAFPGRIYPVNPGYKEIAGLPCYASLEEVPEVVDLVVLVVPIAAALDALKIAARRGVPFAVLTTGGYGEGMSGEEGERQLAALQALCRESGLRVLGPNIIGFVNFRKPLPITFADWYMRDTGQRGGVAIVTHSGSVGGLIFSSIQIERVGIDFWIATGNEAVLETADVIDHLADDPGIHTIVCFLEGVVDGRRFLAAVEKARGQGKAVVALKAGASPSARRSTRAHTCKLSSPAEVYSAVLRQAGVIEAATLPEVTQIVKILATAGRPQAGSVGLISASGGACSVIADYLARAGLDMPVLPEATQAELRGLMPIYGSPENPVDVTADIIGRRQILTGTLAALEKEDTVSTWIVFGRPIIERYHADITDFARRSGKTVLVCTGVPPKPETEDLLREGGVTVIHEPDLLARALGALHRAAGESAAPRDWLAWAPRDAAPRRLNEKETTELLARHGVAVQPGAGAHLTLAIEQDGDFGPLLVLTDAGSGRKAILALPATPAELTELAGEGADAIAATLARIYAETPALAELRLDLARAGAAIRVVGAALTAAA